MIIILLRSCWMKLTMTSILMFFRVLFMLVMWILLSFIKLFLLVLFIGTITYFLNISLVVILICSLGLLLLLIICWMLLMFFALRVGKASLILRTLSVLLSTLEACPYNIYWLKFAQDSTFVLKNFEILLTSLGILVGIGGSSLSILAGLSVSLSLGLLF